MSKPRLSKLISECNDVPPCPMPILALDLDGTLIDSVPDLAAAINRVMAARSLAPFTRPEVAAMVGDGVAMLVRRAFAARGREPDADAIADYIADYTAHAVVETRPFPGVLPALEQLRAEGWRLAICTNKPEAATHALLRALGIDALFAAVGGGDSFPVRKPDPAHLLATLRAAGGVARPECAVMVGDHVNDVRAAHGAGLPCIFAAWGYGAPAMAEGAEAVAASFTEVPALARRLLQQRTA